MDRLNCEGTIGSHRVTETLEGGATLVRVNGRLTPESFEQAVDRLSAELGPRPHRDVQVERSQGRGTHGSNPERMRAGSGSAQGAQR